MSVCRKPKGFVIHRKRGASRRLSRLVPPCEAEKVLRCFESTRAATQSHGGVKICTIGDRSLASFPRPLGLSLSAVPSVSSPSELSEPKTLPFVCSRLGKSDLRSHNVDLDAPLFRFGQCPLLTQSSQQESEPIHPLDTPLLRSLASSTPHRSTRLHLTLKIHLTNRVALAATVLSLMTHMAPKTGLLCYTNHQG